MRKTALRVVEELAAKDARICFIGSDLGFGVMDSFPDPARLFREGISEQHVIGMAAGLALEGKVVYVNTIASFLTRRCYEQIYLDLCLMRAPVRLLASGGGLVYAPLGPTHLAPDDIAILRPLPNMTILAPCDAAEMRRLMLLTPDVPGPIYIRIAKGGDKIVSPEHADYAIGKAVWLAGEEESTLDALCITTGITAQVALEATVTLQAQGIRVGILHCHTIKPLDSTAILNAAKKARHVITVEEHVLTGGLGSAVAELFADCAMARQLHRIGLPDAFFNEHGSQQALLAHHGIHADALVSLIRRMP